MYRFEHKPRAGETIAQSRRRAAIVLGQECQGALEALTPSQKGAISRFLLTPSANMWLSGVHGLFSSVERDNAAYIKGVYGIPVALPTKGRAREDIGEITEALRSASLPLTISARRSLDSDLYGMDGLGLGPFIAGERPVKGLLGAEFRQRGFLTFSALLDEEEGAGSVVFYCDLPKGFRAIYAEPLLDGLGGVSTVYSTGEHKGGKVRFSSCEIIVQRGLTWRIVKAWEAGGSIRLKIMPIRGSDTPEALARDLKEMA